MILTTHWIALIFPPTWKTSVTLSFSFHYPVSYEKFSKEKRLVISYLYVCIYGVSLKDLTMSINNLPLIMFQVCRASMSPYSGWALQQRGPAERVSGSRKPITFRCQISTLRKGPLFSIHMRHHMAIVMGVYLHCSNLNKCCAR